MRRFFPEAIERIAWHQARGHLVCVVSGTLAVLARDLVKVLPGRVDLIATELETATGYVEERGDCEAVWTGEICGAHMTGLAKARAVWRYAEDHGVDLKRSYAYGDRAADLPMLDAVGRAVAVNPSKRLARIARENAWETVRWREATNGERALARAWLVGRLRTGLRDECAGRDGSRCCGAGCAAE